MALIGSKRKREKRAIHDSFGLTAAQSRDPQNILPLPICCMSEVPLETIVLGLGTRYVHVHHGDVECSIFAVDFACRRNDETTSPPSFPILHDIWQPNNCISTFECEACQRRIATLVTA